MSATPGPWTADWSYTREFIEPFCKIHGRDGAPFAEVYGHGPEAEADARIIAAAPDLLAFCKELFENCFERNYSLLGYREELKALIQKAEDANVPPLQ